MELIVAGFMMAGAEGDWGDFLFLSPEGREGLRMRDRRKQA